MASRKRPAVAEPRQMTFDEMRRTGAVKQQLDEALARIEELENANRELRRQAAEMSSADDVRVAREALHESEETVRIKSEALRESKDAVRVKSEALQEAPVPDVHAVAIGLSCAMLGAELRAHVRGFEVEAGTLRIWPQSTSAVLRIDGGEGVPARAFLKTATAQEATANKSLAAIRRDLVSNRVEARFYSEVGPLLHARGVRLFQAFAIDDRLCNLADAEAGDPAGGVLLLLESAESLSYVQKSPLDAAAARCALTALATLHASAWEDRSLLSRCAAHLHAKGGGWWSLHQRGVAELASLHDVWPRFLAAFAPVEPALVVEPRIVQLAERLARLAPWVAEQLDVHPDDPFCTLMHGDYKAANLFLPDPSLPEGTRTAVPVDWQWAGHGLGMRDVAYHLTHAVEVDALAPEGAEEALVQHYCAELRARLTPEAAAAFTEEVAMRQYELALLDYARLVISRFVVDASPESFAKANAGPRAANVGVIYRDVRGAPRLVRRVDALLAHFETESERSEASAER